MNLILSILASTYGSFMQFRNVLYDRAWLQTYRSALPIISIGNVTAGGNAKTPLALAIAGELKKRGKKPVILSRGYRGREKGPIVVLPTHHYLDVGDEPILMAAETDVVVARDRVAGAKFIEQLHKFDVIILDDGFQHRRLGRDVDIVSIDVGSPGAVQKFVKGELLPLGRFREKRDSALRRSSMIILSERGVSKSASIVPELLELLPKGVPQFRSVVTPGGAVSYSGEKLEPPAAVIAFCGIANPEPFFETLRSFGLTPVVQRVFPDHHGFTKGDIEELRGNQADERQLPLVCTVKDAVKLRDRTVPNLFLFTIETVVLPHLDFYEEILRRISTRPAPLA